MKSLHGKLFQMANSEPPANVAGHSWGRARAEPIVLSVIIISYNTRDLTLECLRCLFDEIRDAGLETSTEVWVVDNASGDGSASAVRAAYPQAKLCENLRNEGFGAANNRAMKEARGTWYLLLNSDAFIKKGAILSMLAYGKAHAEVAVIGPKLLNADGTLQVSCWKFPTPMRSWLDSLGLTVALSSHSYIGDYYYWPHDSERRVQFVLGACMLIRRAVYEQLGGFDTRFFIYAEETDWQKRITEAGWEIAFTPHAEVVHLGGASSDSTAAINPHLYASADLYMRKHHGITGLLSMRLAMVIGNLTRMLLWTVVPQHTAEKRRLATARVRQHARVLARQATFWSRDFNNRPTA